jgi:signal transduction histidine kinase
VGTFASIRIGEAYIHLKKYREAEHYLTNGLTLSKELGSVALIQDSYDGLYELDSITGNYQKALARYRLYTDYKDSLLNEANSKQIIQMKEQYESEKKDRNILQLTSEKQKLESDQQINALLLRAKQDSLNIAHANNERVQLESDKVKLENEKMLTLNLYSAQQIKFLGNEKMLQQLQLEKNRADYAIQKTSADQKQKQVVLLSKEKVIRDLQLKKAQQTRNYLMVGLVLFAGLSFFAYNNYRTKQQLKLQRLRNKIASDLHDDVGSTLSSISIFSQMAQAQSKEVIPALETIGESSRKMLDAMADIVWTINPENDQLEKIIMRMRSFAYELLGAKQIDFEFESDDDVSNIKLPMEARRNLYLIFKEATNNMVKYAGANKAMFAIKTEKDKLTMIIRDYGRGFDMNKEMLGNGLKNMRKRAMDIGAQLLVHSLPGKGTTVKLDLAIKLTKRMRTFGTT